MTAQPEQVKPDSPGKATYGMPLTAEMMEQTNLTASQLAEGLRRFPNIHPRANGDGCFPDSAVGAAQALAMRDADARPSRWAASYGPIMHCNLTEAPVRSMADALVQRGRVS